MTVEGSGCELHVCYCKTFTPAQPATEDEACCEYWPAMHPECKVAAPASEVPDLQAGDEGWVPDDREVKFVVRMANALQHQREELAAKVEEIWMSEDWQTFDGEERLSAVIFAIESDEEA